MSDNLDLIQIEKFKNSVSVSDDQCLQYVRKQSVSSEDTIFTVRIGYDCLRSGGAGSEVWNRVYMIAPVKKFGRVGLSTIFLQNKYGGEYRHGRTMSLARF